ncbi:MAG TPA: hypothetical protein VF748_14645 [Candidatus Acidoferrum sp.]
MNHLLAFAAVALTLAPSPALAKHHHHSRHVHAPPRANVAVAPPSSSSEVAEDDAHEYLRRTSSPGYTMLAQGVQKALACLHPTFVDRLVATIRVARAEGIPAAIFSACRPPSMRVGGFEDKFRSMHAYGLAVDFTGIGSPGSALSRRFHEIAAAHGVYGVYGAGARSEWNHYQATGVLSAPEVLRHCITAFGPPSLEHLFSVAARFIDQGFRTLHHIIRGS